MEGELDGSSQEGGRLSASEQENLNVLANSYERDDAEVPGVQRFIERTSAFFGSPTYFSFVIVFILLWVLANSIGSRNGWAYVDRPPFPWLQGIVSANALLLTIAVLIRQNRMAQLAGHRAHLDLQINLLTEQKVSKILELLQKRRDDRPVGVGTQDSVVSELAKPADPEAMLSAIKKRDQRR